MGAQAIDLNIEQVHDVAAADIRRPQVDHSDFSESGESKSVDRALDDFSHYAAGLADVTPQVLLKSRRPHIHGMWERVPQVPTSTSCSSRRVAR